MKLFEKIKDYYNKMSWQGKATLFLLAAVSFQTRGEFMGYEQGYKDGRQEIIDSYNGYLDELERMIEERKMPTNGQDDLENRTKPEKEERKIYSDIYVG